MFLKLKYHFISKQVVSLHICSAVQTINAAIVPKLFRYLLFIYLFEYRLKVKTDVASS